LPITRSVSQRRFALTAKSAGGPNWTVLIFTGLGLGNLTQPHVSRDEGMGDDAYSSVAILP